MFRSQLLYDSMDTDIPHLLFLSTRVTHISLFVQMTQVNDNVKMRLFCRIVKISC